MSESGINRCWIGAQLMQTCTWLYEICVAQTFSTWRDLLVAQRGCMFIFLLGTSHELKQHIGPCGKCHCKARCSRATVRIESGHPFGLISWDKVGTFMLLTSTLGLRPRVTGLIHSFANRGDYIPDWQYLSFGVIVSAIALALRAFPESSLVWTLDRHYELLDFEYIHTQYFPGKVFSRVYILICTQFSVVGFTHR